MDAVALELTDDGDLQDFDIVWVIPIEPASRLRAILVDNAVCEADTEVRVDPCELELRLEWPGELARLGARTLVRVRLTLEGATHACTAEVREPDGAITTRSRKR